MHFIKLITLTVVLLSTNLVFAKDKGVSKKITENPDGSYTIYKPHMLRGKKKIPIYSGTQGICVLFGFDKYLDNTAIDAKQTVAKSVKLNADGSYKGTEINGRPYKEIICYNTDKPLKTSKATKITENPDGSYTIYEPHMLRGKKKIPIYSGTQGICVLFGFDKYLDNTAIDAKQTVAKSVKLNADGSYKGTEINGRPYKEIICYNTDKPLKTSKATKITENPDGSYTIYEPHMLRGKKKIPIYSGTQGICVLFGFDKYLDNTAIDAKQTVAKSVKLNADGSYKDIQTNGKPYKKITCYNTDKPKETLKTNSETPVENQINDGLPDLYVFYVHGDGDYTHKVYSDVKCREGKYCPCKEGQKSCKTFLKEKSDVNFFSKVKDFAESCTNCDVLIMHVRPRRKTVRTNPGSRIDFKSVSIAQDLFFYRDGALQQQKELSSVNDSSFIPLPVISVISLFSKNNALKKETDYFLEQSLHKKYRYQLAFFFGHKMPDKEKKGYFQSDALVKFSVGHFLSGLNRLSQGINQEHKPFDVLFLGQCLSTIETIYEVQKKNTASLVLASPELIAFDALLALDLKSLWTRTHQNKNKELLSNFMRDTFSSTEISKSLLDEIFVGALSRLNENPTLKPLSLKEHISNWMQDTFSAKTPESILDKIFVQTSLSLFDMEHLKKMETSLEEAVQIMNENNQLSQEKREEIQMIAEGTQENAVSFSELPSFNCAPIEKLGPFIEEASPAVLNYTYSGKSLFDILLSDVTDANKEIQPSKSLTSHSGWSCL